MTALVTSCKTLFFYKIKAKVKADVAGAMLLFRLLDTDIIDSEILTFLRFFPPSSKMLCIECNVNCKFSFGKGAVNP